MGRRLFAGVMGLCALLVALASHAQTPAAPPEVFAAPGNSEPVSSIAIQPSGRLLAVGSLDGTIRLWNLGSGTESRVLRGHTGFVTSVAFSPDGKTLATGSDDKTIRLWDALTGQALRSLAGHTGGVTSIAYSPNGQELVSGSLDGTVKVWDLSAKGGVLTLEHTGSVSSVAFSPDGALIIAASADAIKIWTASGQLARTLIGLHSLASFALSPDGKSLVRGYVDGQIEIWELATGRMLSRKIAVAAPNDSTAAFAREMTPTAVNSVAYSPDGQTFASADADNTVKLWNAGSGVTIRTFKGSTGAATSVSFSSDGKTLISGCSDGSTRLWDVNSGRLRVTLMDFSHDASVALTPEGFFSSSSAEVESNLRVRLGGRVFGISSFRESFNRPDLVKKTLAGEDISKYGSVGIAKLSPAIEFVDVPATTTDPNVKINLRLTNVGGGFGPVRIFWNGTVVLQDTELPESGDTITRSYTVPLQAGENDIRVTASNADGSMWSDGRTAVTSNFTLSKTRSASGTLHALVIGIQTYPRMPENNLEYASSDAQLIAEVLKRQDAGLFKSTDIRLLLGAQATRNNIIAALRGLQASVKPGDTLVFYVTGHAVVLKGQYYLVPSDVASTDPASIETQSIDAKSLSALLAAVPSARKLILIDTCDAGNASEAIAFLGHDLGITVLAATASNEEAFVSGYNAHGLFAYVVAQALSGRAADPASGIVTNFLLADYVRTQVPILARAVLHRDQEPTFVVAGESFPITCVGSCSSAEQRAETTSSSPSEPSQVSDYLPQKRAPRVELIQLPPSVNTASLAVKFRIADSGDGIGPMRFFQNGSLLPASTCTMGQPKSGSVEGQCTLQQLVPGPIDLRLSVEDSSWSVANDASGSTLVTPDTLHAVLVGINDFPLSPNADNQLHYAVSDAQLVHDTLDQYARPLFRDVDLKLLTSAQDTTKASITKLLSEMQKKVGSDDVFVFYIASHGIVQDNEYYVITSNVSSSSPDRLQVDALSSKDLAGGLPSVGKRLILIDTCDAGGAIAGLGDAYTVLRTRGDQFGLFILAASDKNENAVEGEDFKKHGLFTYVLANALSGKQGSKMNVPELNDGTITAGALGLYVKTEVHSRYPTQNPQYNEFGDDIPVTRIKVSEK